MDIDTARFEPLKAALSESRIGRYLAAFDGDVQAAIECHHWNCRISHALFLPIELFELTLRNKIDAKIADRFGAEWLIDWPDWLNDKPNHRNQQRKKIEEAIDKIIVHKKTGIALQNSRRTLLLLLGTSD